MLAYSQAHAETLKRIQEDRDVRKTRFGNTASPERTAADATAERTAADVSAERTTADVTTNVTAAVGEIDESVTVRRATASLMETTVLQVV